ncbi:hypothetical protein H5410_046641 [Solanum commersonii]|uniref:Uncharacterized protein n=1 Tax=Solanum commersonii TaxID=4109 RepID=A0A9J5XF01_SOLCO|nr:hypothetical protein H5410_046641 [Solanum commersonii]
MEVFQGLLDVLIHDEREATKIGNQTFLLVTFTGRPRNMCQQNLDTITLNDKQIEVDEIKEYQSAQWVSLPEETWRLFGYPICEMTLAAYHLQGPKSYEDLHMVNGTYCTTFRKSAEKRELQHSDNTLVNCMIEAVSFQLPYSLRRVFATLLVYCNPANPKELWEQFEECMSEDFKNSKSVELRDV